MVGERKKDALAGESEETKDTKAGRPVFLYRRSSCVPEVWRSSEAACFDELYLFLIRQTRTGCPFFSHETDHSIRARTALRFDLATDVIRGGGELLVVIWCD